MNIKREFFAAIVTTKKGRDKKVVEYRPMSNFWKRRIEPLTPPFKLRLLNGMTHPIPEAVVVVKRVTRDRGAREYQLHLGRVLSVKRWDRVLEKPKGRRE